MSSFSSLSIVGGRALTRFPKGRIASFLCLAGAGLILSSPNAHASDKQVLVRTSALGVGPSTGAVSPQALVRTNALIQTQLTSKLAGTKLKKNFDATGWTLVDIPQGMTPAAALQALQAKLGANNVVADKKVRANVAPNDTEYNKQWWLKTIKAPEAWDKTTGSDTIVVAVLDSGAQLDHPDLKNNLWVNPGEIPNNGKDDDGNGYIDDVYGINTVPGEENLPPEDDNGHGTFCEGVIGASTNNGLQVAGINWNVKVMSLRFMENIDDPATETVETEATGYTSAAIECLNYVIKMKKRGINIRVTSNSWGAVEGDPTNGYSPALESAFAEAGKAGLLNVCAAGNGDESGKGFDLETRPDYPASLTDDSIISVGSTDSEDKIADYSNYGIKSVDLAAPGVEILGLTIGSGTGVYSGTSMSAPMVAGAAALLFSQQKGFTAAQAKDRILRTVDRIDGWSSKSVTGGRLNLFRMLNGATNGPPNVSGLIYWKIGEKKIPFKDAKVTISSKTSTTKSDGKYLIETVKTGVYSVLPKLSKVKFTAQTLEVTDLSGNLVLDFEGIPTTKGYYITGTAVDSENKPVKGAVISQNTTKGATPMAVTEEDGTYLIYGLKGGTYRLTADDGIPDTELLPDPTAIKLPAKSGAIAPNGVVNFGMPFGGGPEVTIPSPADNLLVALGYVTPVTITAKDTDGVDRILYILSFTYNGKVTYYNWKTKSWTRDITEPYVTGEADVKGKEATISLKLPKAREGRMTIKAWAKDDYGKYTEPLKRPVRNIDVVIDNNPSTPKS